MKWLWGPRIALRVSGALLLTLLTSACGNEAAPAAEASAASPPATEAKPASDVPAAAPTGAAPRQVRCGDLISAEEIGALGIDAARFDPDKTGEPGMGAGCMLSEISITLFPGSAYRTMIAGLEANAERAGVEPVEGPAVGGASQWTKMHTVRSVMFQSKNERYAANLSGSEEAKLEKLARVLAANMEKR